MKFTFLIKPQTDQLIKVMGWFILFQSLAFVSQAQLGLRKTFAKQKSISWPPSYPHTYKAIARLGFQKYSGPMGKSGFAPNAGLAGELLLLRTFIAGAGYDLSFIPAQDSLGAAKAHRLSLHTGFVIPLDNFEKHHLVVVFRPGLAFLRSGAGSSASVGLAFGLQYEYTLNSDVLLSPELMINKYAGFGASGYRLSNLLLGFRVSFGR